MATMTELHNRIRSGDVSVVGSRQHENVEECLVSKEKWEQVHASGNVQLTVPLSVEEYLIGTDAVALKTLGIRFRKPEPIGRSLPPYPRIF